MGAVDDIDDLLDEFESAIGANDNAKSRHKSSHKSRPDAATALKPTKRQKPFKKIPPQSNSHSNAATGAAITTSGRGILDDVSDLLEIDVSDAHHVPPLPRAPNKEGPSVPRARQARVKGGIKSKCSPVLLRHCESSGKGCRSLWCTGCDFKVSWFDNMKWDASVEYLFFRNAYPDKERLAPMLQPSQGSRAYCCQCTWQVVKGTDIAVSNIAKCKWICTGGC